MQLEHRPFNRVRQSAEISVLPMPGRLSLPKWFTVVCLMEADKGGISVERLSKMLSVAWLIFYRILMNLHQSIGDAHPGTCSNDLLRRMMHSSGDPNQARVSSDPEGNKLVTSAVA